MLQISLCDFVTLYPARALTSLNSQIRLVRLIPPTTQSFRGAARGQETPDPPGSTSLSFTVCTVSTHVPI